jgi:hypothetical protein
MKRLRLFSFVPCLALTVLTGCEKPKSLTKPVVNFRLSLPATTLPVATGKPQAEVIHRMTEAYHWCADDMRPSHGYRLAATLISLDPIPGYPPLLRTGKAQHFSGIQSYQDGNKGISFTTDKGAFNELSTESDFLVVSETDELTYSGFYMSRPLGQWYQVIVTQGDCFAVLLSETKPVITYKNGKLMEISFVAATLTHNKELLGTLKKGKDGQRLLPPSLVINDDTHEAVFSPQKRAQIFIHALPDLPF